MRDWFKMTSTEEKEIKLQSDLESEMQSEMESEVERDLESKLKSELESINEKLATIAITLTGASSNRNYKKIASQEPVIALLIPNSLFGLWKRRTEIEESLMQEKSKLTEMANASLKIIKLDTCVSDLENRLQNESRRF